MRDCASIGTYSHVHYAHHKMMIKASNLPLCLIEVWRLRSRVKYMRSPDGSLNLRIKVTRAMAHFMIFHTIVGIQQGVRVPRKQANSSWSSHHDHLGSSSTVALLHNPL